MDFFLKKFFEVHTRFNPYFFETGSTFANDDSLLTVALHVDDRSNAQDIFGFLEFFYLYLTAVGDFFFIIQEDLLSDDLRGHKPLGFIGDLIFRKIGWMVG